MRDHWARTADLWPEGGTRETWLVTAADLPELAAVAAAAAPGLLLPHLDLVPVPWLHVTLAEPPARALTATLRPPRAVDEGVVVELEADGLGEWPHAALAYAHGDGPAPDLRLPPLTGRIETVTHARMRREPRLYAWDVLERVVLSK